MVLFLVQLTLLAIQLVLLIYVCAFLYRALSELASLPLDVPFVPTPLRYAREIAKALDITPGDIVYELGSGNGCMLLALAALYPNAHFIGIERNVLLHAEALLRKRLHGRTDNIEFRRGNLFDADLTKASKIYVYLLDSVMDRLLPHLERASRDITVVSRAFRFKNKAPRREVRLAERPGGHNEHMLYIYDLTRSPENARE